MTTRSKHGCLRSFHSLASSAPRGPEDKQRITQWQGSPGVLWLAVATGQRCWLVQQPFHCQVHLIAHSVDSQALPAAGHGRGVVFTARGTGQDAQRGVSGFHMEKPLGKSALMQKALGRQLLVQLWGTELSSLKETRGRGKHEQSSCVQSLWIVYKPPRHAGPFVGYCWQNFPRLWPKTPADSKLPSTCLKRIWYQGWKAE